MQVEKGLLGVFGIEGDVLVGAAAFDGAAGLAMMQRKVPEEGQKPGAELGAALALKLLQDVALDDLEELWQLLREHAGT